MGEEYTEVENQGETLSDIEAEVSMSGPVSAVPGDGSAIEDDQENHWAARDQLNDDQDTASHI